MPALNSTQELLDDARAQYHALITGRAASVVVDQNGERVEFTKVKSADLYAYIVKLEGLLAPTNPCFNNGPAGFFF